MMNTTYLPVPEKHMILGKDHYYSKDCYKTQLNNNVMVVGSSGAGKTRRIVKPNLLQCDGSYIVSDPKGSLSKEFSKFFKDKGYAVYRMDFIHPERSAKYNPILRCKTTTDILKLANTLVYELNKSSGNTRQDPFWDEAAMILFSAMIGYMIEDPFLTDKDRNLKRLVDLIKQAKRDEADEDGGNSISRMDREMERHKMRMRRMGKESWAASRYEEYITAPDKTHATINITTLAKLAMFDSIELREMLNINELDFASFGQRPTVVFVEVSDTDRSKDALVNLFYSQAMNELCDYADGREDSCLPVPVQFILDDFATNARIDGFERIIANIRSRNISAMLCVQAESQIGAVYGHENSKTIVDCCNTYVYMGGSDPDMAEIVARRANKPVSTILNMPLSKSWIFRRGQNPVMCDNFDWEWFKREKRFGGPSDYRLQNGR